MIIQSLLYFLHSTFKEIKRFNVNSYTLQFTNAVFQVVVVKKLITLSMFEVYAW